MAPADMPGAFILTGKAWLKQMKICVYDILDYEEPILKRLQQQLDVELVPVHGPLTADTLALAEGCGGISVLGYSRVDRPLLEAMAQAGIRHLSTRTIGYDHIDAEAAKALGVHVYHAHYDPNNVADFTVMMMLILLRKAKVSICRALVNDFSLDGLMGRELRSLTVGVIGTGKIGAAVIRNLSGFGCRVLACAHHPDSSLAGMAEYVELDQLYTQSDIVTLHVPLTQANYHMIDAEALGKMKPGVILINTARGQLIDTESLIAALESGQVGGAGIDTLEEESGVMHVHVGTRIIDNRSLLYLKQFPNVVYTQHYAFFTQEATESMVLCGLQSILDGSRGISTPCEVK